MRTIALEDGEIDLIRGVVRRRTRVATLTRNEQRILEYLSDRPVQDVAREELEELGFSSGRAVDQAVFRLRAKVETQPHEPVHLLTAYGTGYRLVPAERAPELARCNLPPPRHPLLGRDDLVDELIARLGPQARLGLVGPAGVGKSRLAAEVARRVAGTWAVGGAWRVDLSTCTDVSDAIARLADALHIEEASTTAVQGALSAGGPALLLLDDADAASEAVRALIELPVAVLCTCRSPLELPELEAYPVPPLDVADAAALFLARASELRDLSAEEKDPDLLAAIARRTDGLPLALELAAQRVRSMPPAKIARALEDQLRLLRRPGTDRHASMAATLAWTWDVLEPAHRAALVQAAVFPGSFDDTAADAVIEPGGAAVVATLGRLGLAHRGDDGRWRLWRAVRELALRQGTPAAAVARHRDHFVAQGAETAEPRRHHRSTVDALRPELDNLRAALEQAWPDRVEDACKLWIALIQITRTTRQDPRMALGFERLEVGSPLRLRVGGLLVWSHVDSGRWADMLALAERLVDEATAHGAGASLRADALRNLAAARAQVGDTEAAIVAAREALSLAHDPLTRMRALGSLGAALTADGRQREALGVLQEATDLARDVGSSFLTAWLHNLGITRHLLGDLEGARQAWETAIEVTEAEGDRQGAANLHYNLAWSDLLEGDLDAALAGFEAAWTGYVDLGLRSRSAWGLATVGSARAALGDLQAGLQDLHDAVELLQPQDRMVRALGVRLLRATMLGLADDPVGAAEQLDELGSDELEALGFEASQHATVQQVVTGSRALPDALAEIPAGVAREARTLWTLILRRR